MMITLKEGERAPQQCELSSYIGDEYFFECCPMPRKMLKFQVEHRRGGFAAAAAAAAAAEFPPIL